MPEPVPIHETVYSGPPIRETVYSGSGLQPGLEPTGDSLPDSEQAIAELRTFSVRIFAWITGALLLSAFFASYSDRLESDLSSFMVGQAIWVVISVMIALAYVVSRKVADMPTSVAISVLIVYSGFQGAMFGGIYRGAYQESLAPVYLCIATLFALLCVYGRATRTDLTSWRGLLIGVVAALPLAVIFKEICHLQPIGACAATVCPWLLLSLIGYHRDFLCELPTSFDADTHEYKAAAVGALQIYLDLMIVMILILRIDWLREPVSLTGKPQGQKSIEL